jgi:PAS domain S-box-containing protein
MFRHIKRCDGYLKLSDIDAARERAFVIIKDISRQREIVRELISSDRDAALSKLTSFILDELEERKRIEDELKETNWALGERVKELRCLYGINEITEQPGITLDGIMEGVLTLIPPAWQYPDVTCARITVDGQTFQSQGFRETEWSQSADIEADGEAVGSVEVFYTEEMPKFEEGPFLKEERDLINAIAYKLGIIVAQRSMEEALNKSHDEMVAILEGLGDAVVVNDGERFIYLNRKAAEIFGYENPSELVGKPYLGFFPEHEELIRERAQSELEGGNPPSMYETAIHRRDGTVVPVEFYMSVIEFNGKPAILKGIRDITERKKI